MQESNRTRKYEPTVESKMIDNSNSDANANYRQGNTSSSLSSSSFIDHNEKKKERKQIALIRALPIRSLTIQCINECYSLPYEENRISLCHNFYFVLRMLTPKLFDKRKSIPEKGLIDQKTKNLNTTNKSTSFQKNKETEENLPSPTIISSSHTTVEGQNRASIFAESFPLFPFEALFQPNMVVYFKNCFGYLEDTKTAH